MAYVMCMPACVVTMTHGMDNIVSGTMQFPQGEVAFRTRGHVIKAVNKIYRGSSWKPFRNADVLIDGDLTTDMLIVDHVEQAVDTSASSPIRHPHLDEIARMIERKRPSKALRHHSTDGKVWVRFTEPVSRPGRGGRIEEEILHGIHDTTNGEWRLVRVSRQGGAPAGSGLDQETLIILARAAGRELLVGESARDVDQRRQEEMRQERKTREMTRARPIAAAQPVDADCPF